MKQVFDLNGLSELIKAKFGDMGYEIQTREFCFGDSECQLVAGGKVLATWKGRLMQVPPLDGVTPRGPREYYDLVFTDGTTIPEVTIETPQVYQPELWVVRKDSVYAAISALEANLLHLRQALADHDKNVGRTLVKDRTWAEKLEQDIESTSKALMALRSEPASRA